MCFYEDTQIFFPFLHIQWIAPISVCDDNAGGGHGSVVLETSGRVTGITMGGEVYINKGMAIASSNTYTIVWPSCILIISTNMSIKSVHYSYLSKNVKHPLISDFIRCLGQYNGKNMHSV